MNEAERAELVRRAVQGDADALQRLIVYYHAALRRFIERKMAEAQDPATAQTAVERIAEVVRRELA